MVNREAELAVIGAIMNGGRVDINPDDIGSPDLRTLYKIMAGMRDAKKKIDLVTLNEETSDTMTDTIIEAMRCGIPSMGQYYANIVKEYAVRRFLADWSGKLNRDVSDRSTDVQACLENAKQKLSSLSLTKGQWITAAELSSATMAYLEKLSTGAVKPIGSGISDIDKLIGGFYPGELTVIGAKPGAGKTVFGMVMALDAAKKGKRVGILNLEMLDTQYGARIVSNLGGIDAMKLRKGTLDPDDWEQVLQAIKELSKLPAAFLFNARYIEELVSAVRQVELDILVVDYLQLVRTRQNLESERLRMAHISWALKELAVDKRIPVIAMSQLRRPDPSADNKMPSMRDLRESGNLEADADGIILLHEPVDERDPYVYKDDKQHLENWKKAGYRYICMKVEKQRQGAVGTVPVLFDANKMRYIGIERTK